MHKSWKQGKYVDMTGHCVTMLDFILFALTLELVL